MNANVKIRRTPDGVEVRVDGELRCLVRSAGRARLRLSAEGRERFVCERYADGARDRAGDFYFTAKDIETAARKAIYFFDPDQERPT